MDFKDALQYLLTSCESYGTSYVMDIMEEVYCDGEQGSRLVTETALLIQTEKEK